MTSDSLQDLATLGLVAAAMIYVVRRAWLVFGARKATGCGACASCPSSQGDPAVAGPPLQVVTIGPTRAGKTV